jgi:hypothetical protein
MNAERARIRIGKAFSGAPLLAEFACVTADHQKAELLGQGSGYASCDPEVKSGTNATHGLPGHGALLLLSRGSQGFSGR